MAQVTNPTSDDIEVPSLGFTLEAGGTITVGDDDARTLPSPPFKIEGLPATAAPEVQQPAPTPSGEGAAATPATPDAEEN